MDQMDERILDLMKGNARITYQELGDRLGISRVAAKKRVKKLEKTGVIRGYNTRIYREDEVTVIIDIVTKPGKFEQVLEYVSTRTAFVRQIFTTSKENHIHMVAASTDRKDLRYLVQIIRKNEDIKELTVHVLTEVIKDVYGGVRYDKGKIAGRAVKVVDIHTHLLYGLMTIPISG